MDGEDHLPLAFDGEWTRLILEGPGLDYFETTHLVQYVPKQRWFAAKSREVKSVHVVDWAVLKPSNSALTLVEVQYQSGPTDTYMMPARGSRGRSRRRIAPQHPQRRDCHRGKAFRWRPRSDPRSGFERRSLRRFVFTGCAENREIPFHRPGQTPRVLRGVPEFRAFAGVLGNAETPLPVKRGIPAEQSNTSILYGDRFILKLFRRQEPGINPDCEIEEVSHRKGGLRPHPSIRWLHRICDGMKDGEPTTLGMMQGLKVASANEGDGWKWTIEELDRYYEMCAPLPFPDDTGAAIGNVRWTWPSIRRRGSALEITWAFI